jgi:hypothetical protein
MAWIDYQNAVDNVLHSWLIKSFQLFGINNKIITFTKKTMRYWKTSFRLRTEGKIIETEDLEIQHGIFQEDSLSPPLYCISLIPLTQQLNKLNTGHKEHTTYTKISNLRYIDNLKLIEKHRKNSKKRSK